VSKKVLFLDRDGTLVLEPPDGQVDSLEKIEIVPGVIPALLRFKKAGYEFVIVTNQNGLGSPAFPRASFVSAQNFIVRLFKSQGIEFTDTLICPHTPTEGCDCRKPAVGLVRSYLADQELDRAASAVIGDRDTDLVFAANMGIRGLKVGPAGQGADWAQIAHELLDAPRVATIDRQTRETQIHVRVDLDAAREPDVSTGLGFFDHMLEQLGKHGGFSLLVRCSGDLDVDEHHTIEDVALAIGQALNEALGERRGIQRYGFLLPMDETQAQVALDLGGRAYLVFEGEFPRNEVGGMPTELVPHFFRSLSDTLRASLHIRVQGENTHHMIEACFKSVARALRQAIQRKGDSLPSTKGSL